MANNRVKRFMRDLEGLGFVPDHEASSARKGRHVYRHPNDREQALRVSEQMSDSGITMVRRKAEQIAGLSTSGDTTPSSIKERARIKKRSEKERRDAETQARNERAARAEAVYREREAIELSKRREREMRDLMNPGYGR